MKNFKILFVLFFVLFFTGCVNNKEDNNQVIEKKVKNDVIIDDKRNLGEIERSLIEIFNDKSNIKCSFSTKDESSSQSGFYYINGVNKNVRIDSDIYFGETIPSNKTKMYGLILSDGYVYSWFDNASMPGMKMKVDIDAVEVKDGGINFNDKMKFSCEEWIVDESYFNLPENINFQDYSNLISPVK